MTGNLLSVQAFDQQGALKVQLPLALGGASERREAGFNFKPKHNEGEQWIWGLNVVFSRVDCDVI